MYAVIQTGGKQYRVQPGDIFQVEKLEGDVGAAVKFDQVLLVAKDAGITLGKPLVSGAAVSGEIVGQGRGEKILIIKMKRRKQYRRTQGHRQYGTEILVTGIANGSDTATLSATDKQARLSKFFTALTPKGLPFTPALSTIPKTAEQRAASAAPAPKKAAAPKAAAPKREAAPKTAAKAKKPASKK